jgi:hypothetical protein
MKKTSGRQSPEMEHPKFASREELNSFLDGLEAFKKKARNEDKAKQQEGIRSYLQQFERSYLQGLMGRAFADAMKSPSQKLGTAKPPSAEVKSGEGGKHAAKRKRRPSKNRRRGASR